MDFALTEEQRLLRDSVKKFIARHAPPELQREWDEGHRFPIDLWRRMGTLGWLGMPIPQEHGGAGASLMDIAVFIEELSYGMTGLSAAFQRSACYGGMVISRNGTEEQKRAYLPPLARGEAMVAIALSEPNAGSDAASIQLRAVADQGTYVLTGQKIYTSGADLADWLIVAARTDPEAKPRDGITTFIVPRETPGIEIRPMSKLGNWTIATCEVFFSGVRVPAANILGGLHRAWQTTLSQGLDAERLAIGAHCTGSAQKALDIATDYAGKRVQFGRKIGSFQMIKQKLADMAVSVHASRLITYQAAWLFDQGLPCRREASMAKLLASETWNRVAYEAMQVLGGTGYMMDSELQRHFRDARLYTIGGGTSEIQRLIIAHELVS